MNLEDLSSRVFTECLHTTFRIEIPQSDPLAVQLAEVTERHDSPRLEQFSVIFHGPVEIPLRQGTYLLEHERLGKIELFLVPVGPEGGHLRYEAVFNRVRRTDLPTA